ncbi:TPA: hypothetical protein N0F65_011928 [Lagenidium giganteum]|uniref:ATPase AAA-type core domain-containing protein n=1 Tax=Lagenidium giganteum TaxID=4803 RepID=A0AAV2YUP7_9STRA|nr:TPA: hypothetical protein N0F65_011928 [Lagenidium giganteum]
MPSSATELNDVVCEKMEQLNLTAFENKLAGSLSGGNKRKLSVAMAMIGSPSILFLDEPSTGMDPVSLSNVSRRFMWDVISEISTYNKETTVVLTTHSMEECEALWTRVDIMVGGGLKCLADSNEEVADLVLRHYDSLDTKIKITENDIEEACGLFGQPAWKDRIDVDDPTGDVIAKETAM